MGKKKPRVGSSKIDVGVEVDKCFKIYLVSRAEEVDSMTSSPITPVDFKRFFKGDKIYGYKNLKITVWVSSISLRAYADISYNGSSDGGMGITEIHSAIANMFGENLFKNKEAFLQSFSADCDDVKSLVMKGQKLLSADTNEQKVEELSRLEVYKFVGDDVESLYNRLLPFVLLLIDGGNPIEDIDSRWEIYLLVQKPSPNQKDDYLHIVGFAAVCRLDRYRGGKRLRLRQILVLPPYQLEGYASCLLEVLNKTALFEVEVYELTFEGLDDSLQILRTVLDVERLYRFKPVESECSSIISRLKQDDLSERSDLCQIRPASTTVEEVRKLFKINEKQFFQCWEVLIYLALDLSDNKLVENFWTVVSSRVKTPYLVRKDSEGSRKRFVDVVTPHDEEMSFRLFESGNGDAQKPEMDENGGTEKEHLRQLVKERIQHIEVIAERVSKERL